MRNYKIESVMKMKQNMICCLVLVLVINLCACSSNSEDTPLGSSGDTGIVTVEYTKNDLRDTWSEDAVKITLADDESTTSGSGVRISGNQITITAEGTYVISGTLSDGQLCVDADKKDDVQLVFGGVDITNSNSAPVFIKQGDKIVITLAPGSENVLTDGSEYVFEEGSDEPSAALFSKDDLTINGQGKLTVIGNYKDGIRTNDDLKIVSGTIEVTAVGDAVFGKDSVAIKDGDITIDSGNDGIKANNDTDKDKGYVVIEGGNVRISAGDDGVHAERSLKISDGTIIVEKSYEAYEGLTVEISGGTVIGYASDDGINAAGGSDGEAIQFEDGSGNMQRGGDRKFDCGDGGRMMIGDGGFGRGGDMFENNPDAWIKISGGFVYINADGDGIDSNGSLYVTGGTTLVDGPTNGSNGALDYAGTASITGGVLVAVGSSQMAQGFNTEEGQPSIRLDFMQTQQAQTLINISTRTGESILSYLPTKNYQSIVISAPELELGAEYVISTDGSCNGDAQYGYFGNGTYSRGTEVLSITLDNILTSVCSDGTEIANGMMGGGMPGGGRMPGGREMPDDGQMPGGGQISGDGQRIDGEL